jgi:hypothetical protein
VKAAYADVLRALFTDVKSDERSDDEDEDEEPTGKKLEKVKKGKAE